MPPTRLSRPFLRFVLRFGSGLGTLRKPYDGLCAIRLIESLLHHHRLVQGAAVGKLDHLIC
jgi:hypothetical protein